MTGRRNSQQAVATFWTRAKTSSKAGFDKLWATADKLGDPVNKLSNKVGSEAFWPTTLDKEADKAARILRSFCKDGFYEDEVHKPADGPQQKQRVLKRIPSQVIKDARGLAIFTTMRTGLWVSGAGGCGILVGRKEDGSWSQPAGIMLHTAGLGFLIGVDIYDCVLVLRTQQAVDAFSKWRCTVGGEISAVAGPAGVGGILESEVHKRQAPVFTYLKSRGFYAGAQIDGTVIIERTDEDERFYGEKISAKDILAGKAQSREPELRRLMATLKSAEGDRDVDDKLLPTEPPPADMHVVESSHMFGVPDREDPDPFGFHALEKEGFVLREAGSRAPVRSEQFEFKPSVKSPVYDTFRRSVESSPISSWRGSVLSTSTTAEKERERDRPKYVTSDSATQTDFPGSVFGSPRSKRSIDSGFDEVSPTRTPRSQPNLGLGIEGALPEENQLSKDDEPETPRGLEHEKLASSPTTENKPETNNRPSSGSEDEDDGHEIHEAPIVHQVQQATRPQVITKAKMVAVPKRGPPPRLPPRHPGRAQSSSAGEAPDGQAHISDADSETASIASVVSVGRPASIRSVRSGRAESIRGEKNTASLVSANASTARIPAEEKSTPILEDNDTTSGRTEVDKMSNEGATTPPSANVTSPDLEPYSSPMEKHIASVRSLGQTSGAKANVVAMHTPELKRNTSETNKSITKTSSSELTRTSNDRFGLATTVNKPSEVTSTQIPPPPRPLPNISQVRQNSGSGSVSALKNRFETSSKPAPIKTSSSSRPSSSHSNNANRSNSPLKQLASYTTSAKEVKAGRITPTTPSPQPDNKDELLPGPSSSTLVDGDLDPKPADETAHVNGIIDVPSLPPQAESRSLRTGRSPLNIKPDADDSLTDDAVAGSQERSISPVKTSKNEFSIAGIRNSLHPLRNEDGESDLGSRSRSVSPMKSPVKLDPEEDFS